MDHMTVTLSEHLVPLLPSNADEASLVVNEIVEQFFLSQEEPDDQKLENRPDWQAGIERGRQDRTKGRVVSHEEVMLWHRNHR